MFNIENYKQAMQLYNKYGVNNFYHASMSELKFYHDESDKATLLLTELGLPHLKAPHNIQYAIVFLNTKKLKEIISKLKNKVFW